MDDRFEPATFMQLKTLYDLIEHVSADDLEWLTRRIYTDDDAVEMEYWIMNRMRINDLNATLKAHIRQGV